MLSLQQRLLRCTPPTLRVGPTVQLRHYKKQKMSATEISEALTKKRDQKKTLLESYSQKYGTKQQASNESERDNLLSKARKLKRQKEVEGDGDFEGDEVMPIDEWFESLRAKHFNRPEVEQALSPQLSYESYAKAMHLHTRDPHYWNPVRLANLFKTPVEMMRGLIFEAKIIDEAREKGIEVYDDIEAGFRMNFPTMDMTEGFEDKANFDIPIKKIHNPWYFINPGLKSGELLKFIRSRETRYYREASRIPTQRYARMQEFKEVLPQGIEQRKLAHKKAKYFMVDSSSCYNLYTRPILVRDHDNTWRSATWEERRGVYNYQRPVKRCPLKVPFIYPDDNQPDRVAIRDKPPSGFDIQGAYTENEDERLPSNFREADNITPENFDEVVAFTQNDFRGYEPVEDEDIEEGNEDAIVNEGGFWDEGDGRIERPGQRPQGRGFGLQGKFNLNPKRRTEETNDTETRTNFNEKWRVKFDYGNTWKDPTVV